MKQRNTQSKNEIIDVLKLSNEALSHEMIQSNLKNNIDRATIYRVLNKLCETGKVHKVVGDDGKLYFAMCRNFGSEKKIQSHNHIHFRCLNCGKFECQVGEISIPLPKGYNAVVYNLVISGYCSDCIKDD